jgi:perosamine synthetase
MWVRNRFDIGWRDLGFGVGSCFAPGTRARVVEELERRWQPDGSGLACLSVRSGFDLLLSALALPHGSEVIVSAYTIPHMVDILREHGLVPVPVDIDLRSLVIEPAALERARSARTRAILVAHLFGGRVPLADIADFARAHGLLLLEDCAQAFCGTYKGDPDADVAMFSFGAIKTATAFGGAMLTVRDPALLDRMRRIHRTWPVQTRPYYLRRLLKYAALKPLEYRASYGLGVRVFAALGLDHDAVVNEMARGFSGRGFFAKIRRQPSQPLLSLLAHRLERFDPDAHEARHVAPCARVAALVAPAVERPCDRVQTLKHWMFPFFAADPQAAVVALRRAGFDATRGASSLTVVEPPIDRPELDPVNARRAASRIVYAPLYAAMPERERERLAGVLRSAACSPVIREA